MAKHCRTCRCEDEAERRARRAEEQREEVEREFVRRHSVLTEGDLAWARRGLARRWQSAEEDG